MLEGPDIVLACLIAGHPESVGNIFPEKDPSAIYYNLALTLGHHVQPLAAALVRLPIEIVGNLGMV